LLKGGIVPHIKICHAGNLVVAVLLAQFNTGLNL